ncbi:HAMP domain-containing sensor histidine kinase [Rapidithrix thailandica]|uniref:histidine kinase n=1 Tax=Rapidithrix thailandica TaxID=413964 RepID=A0AAW9SD33_9BACT
MVTALLALGVTFSLRYYLKNISNTELYLTQVEENLSREAEVAENIIFEYKQHIKNNHFTFEQLLEEQPYPIYIFNQKKLIFWSDHRYAFSYADIQGYYNSKCIEINNSIFLVKKSLLVLNNHDYEFVVLIPLKQDYQVENQYLQTALNSTIFPDNRVEIVLSDAVGYPILSRYHVYLCSIIFPNDYDFYIDKQWVVFFFFAVFVVFYLLEVKEWVALFLQKKKIEEAFWVLFLGLFGLRGIMLIWNFPYSIVPFELFDPTVFASSVISPSLGDLFLNMLASLVFIAFLFKYFLRLFNYRKLKYASNLYRKVLTSLLVILSYLALYYLYYILENIYFNSRIIIDITQELSITLVKLFYLLVFVISAGIYFMVSHLASKLLVRLSNSLYDTTFTFIVASLVYYLVSFAMDMGSMLIFNVNAFYFAITTFFNFPITLRRSGYSTFMYLVTCAATCAIVGAYAVYRFDRSSDIINKHKFANQLLIENDLMGEFGMMEMTEEVQKDQLILNKLSEPYSAEIIEKKIKRRYLGRYYDKYDIKINVFDDIGISKREGGPQYDSLLRQYNRAEYQTEYNNIFFINNIPTGLKQYICFIPIREMEKLKGSIVLELTLKKIVPNSIHPIFIDKKYQGAAPNDLYSYAIYSNHQLIYSYGEYSYDNAFLDLFRPTESLFLDSEIETQNYHHLRVPGEGNKNIIISSSKYPYDNIFSNFSFLFFWLVFFILSGLTLYSFFLGEERANLSFATKVQIYLNFAFFVPMIIVSTIIISLLSKENEKEVRGDYIEKAQNIRNELITTLTSYEKQLVSKEAMLDAIIEASKLTQSDINLYNKQGRLIGASQSLLFDINLYSEWVNPEAYAGLIERKQSKLVSDERIGSLDFNAAYVGMFSNVSGEPLGVISIPFLSSKANFKHQVIQIFSVIIRIFTFIFAILLIISYLSSRALIKPLNLITQKLKKTTLSGDDEPLDYNKEDEFGLLIGEYNKMLVKLEESRIALARSEKEIAWREMAKQVAHEIKNPLTPMKLQLQQLQRVLDTDNERVKRSITVLLDQIDTLSDIATSFSSFAKMPLPKDERFEISSVLKETLSLHSLHSNSRPMKVVEDISEGSFFVLGDQKLMSRIFTNLILNGIQSVPEGRFPEIHVSLTPVKPNKILVEIRDNGSGIPEYIQNKIFVPDFSTKVNGSGIGLAIAKRGIEHSGGSIWFETEIGIGTSFFVEMPLCKEA